MYVSLGHGECTGVREMTQAVGVQTIQCLSHKHEGLSSMSSIGIYNPSPAEMEAGGAQKVAGSQ